jgi:anti-anti-sigma regulatory factor
LGRGGRDIVLDLSSVSRIDAGGVGELVRAYNIAYAMDGSLRIVNATKWVRETLERVDPFDLLSADTDDSTQKE